MTIVRELDGHRRESAIGVSSAPRRFTYDSTQRLIAVQIRGASLPTITYGNFDARQRPRTIGLPGGQSITASYNPRGELTQQTVPWGATGVFGARR